MSGNETILEVRNLKKYFFSGKKRRGKKKKQEQDAPASKAPKGFKGIL